MLIDSKNNIKGYQYTGLSRKLPEAEIEDEVDLNYSESLERTRDFQSDLDYLKRASRKINKEEALSSDDYSIIEQLMNSGPKNPDDSECVKKFMDLFEAGKVKPGDIILMGKPLNPLLNIMGKCIPGDYTHTAMYLGKNEKGEHVSIEGWWPRVAIHRIDSHPKSWNSWSIVSPHQADGKELTDEDRKKAVEFARAAEGCEYNLNLLGSSIDLPVSKEDTEFYCSQLAWAAYYYTINLDLDQNPDFNIKYAWGVAPQELHDTPNVSIIAEYENQ